MNKKIILSAFFLFYLFGNTSVFAQIDSLLKVNTLLLVKKLNTDIKLIAEPSEKENRVYYLEDLKNNLFESEKSLIGEDWKEGKNNYNSSVNLSIYLQKLQDSFQPSFSWQLDASSISIDSLNLNKKGKGSYQAKIVRYFRAITNQNLPINIKDTCILHINFTEKKSEIETLKIHKITFNTVYKFDVETNAKKHFATLTELIKQLSDTKKRAEAIKSIGKLELVDKITTQFIISKKDSKTSIFLLDDFLQKLEVVKDFRPKIIEAELVYYYDYHKQDDGKSYYKTKITKILSDGKTTVSDGVEVTDKPKKQPFFLFHQISLNDE
jgi:hypothetical protein